MYRVLIEVYTHPNSLDVFHMLSFVSVAKHMNNAKHAKLVCLALFICFATDTHSTWSHGHMQMHVSPHMKDRQ